MRRPAALVSTLGLVAATLVAAAPAGWRLKLIHRARATETYKAYKLRTVYKNGRKK